MEDKYKNIPPQAIADEWMDEDKLLLLECWARDGYTYQDIANRVGVDYRTILRWRKKYPEIRQALNQGRELIDYKVENALLKSALGYRTKEVKVITTMRYGKTIETVTEVTEKDQPPSVTAIQVWLYNRAKDKWKKNNDNILEIDEEDSTIQITVKRADGGRNSIDQQIRSRKDKQSKSEDIINNSIEVKRKPINEDTGDSAVQSQKPSSKSKMKSQETMEDNLDYWPDNWEE